MNAKKSQETAVAETKKSNVATVNDVSTLPGFEEGINMDEITLPRVKLVQGLSQEATDENLDIRQGWLINHITKERYETPLKFIPLTKTTIWIRYNARQEDHPHFDPNYEKGAMIYMHHNQADVPGQDLAWLNGNPPKARKYISFLSYLPDYPDFPAVISMGKTSVKVAENIVNTLFMKRKAMYESMFELSVTNQEKNGNKYYAYQAKFIGDTPKDLIEPAKGFYNAFAQSVQQHAQDSVKEEQAWTE